MTKKTTNSDEWGNIELPGLSDEKLFKTNWQKVQSNREASMLFKNKEQAHEIFWKCWGPDRGEKLYKTLALEYNVSAEGIITLVRGHGGKVHAWCPVDEVILKNMKDDWIKQYQSIKIYAVRPGYDQLNNYDRLYRESGQYIKVKDAWKMTTPSVVFHCRYVLENPTPAKVREYCDSIGIPRLTNDLGQYKKILNLQYTWLRNEPSEIFEFSSYDELGDFLTNHKDNKEKLSFNRQRAWEKVFDRIIWRGKSFTGWMFYEKLNGDKHD